MDKEIQETSEKSTLKNGSLAASLPSLSEETLEKCLSLGSKSLSGFDGSICLPYVRTDHDLVEILNMSVVNDNSQHPRRPSNEITSTILNTNCLANMVFSEMKRYGVAIKTFSNALGMNSASFSLALREPRHWFDANLVQVCMTHSWLSIRSSIFQSIESTLFLFFRNVVIIFYSYGLIYLKNTDKELSDCQLMKLQTWRLTKILLIQFQP